MRSRLIVTLLLLSMTQWVGCTFVKNFPKKRRHDAIYEEVIQAMTELNQQLASIRDEGSLQSAMPGIRSVLGRITDLIAEQKQLRSDLGRVNKVREEQMIERLKPVMSEMQSQLVRIRGYRGAQQIAAEMMKLARVALAPPPPPSSGSRPSATTSVGSPEVREDLRALGMAYHRYIETNQAAPKSWEDLLTSGSSQGSATSATSIARLKAQNAVVFFGIHFREAVIGSTNYVLGFERKTPQSGGLALLLDGSVTYLTPAQLCGHLKVQAGVDLAVFGRSPPVTVMFSPNVQANPEIPPHLAHLANQAPPGPPGPPGFPSIPKSADDNASQPSSNSQSGQSDAPNSGFGPLIPPSLAGASIPTSSGEMPGSKDPPARESGKVANPFGTSDSSDPSDSSSSTRIEPSSTGADKSVPSPFGSAGTAGASPPPATAGSTTPAKDSGKVANPFAPLNTAGSTTPAKSNTQAGDDNASPSVPNPFGSGSTTTSSASGKEEDKTANGTVVNPFAPPSSSGGSSAERPTGGKLVESDVVGGSGGSPFRHLGSVEQPVVGVRYRLGQWQGKDRLGKIEPLFANSSLQPGWEIVVARDGYAVGAVQVDGDQFVNAIRLAFMRMEDGRLDTKDTYVSDWIGTPEGSHQKTLNGKGAPVIGIVGRGLAIVDAIGLVFVER